MGKGKLGRRSEELRCHQDTLGVFVQVLSLIAELSQLCQDDSTNYHLLGAKSISKLRVVFKDLTELFDNV